MQLENGTWVMVMDGTKALILRNVTDGQDPNLEVVRKDENDATDSKAVSTTGPRDGEEDRRRPTADDFHNTTETSFAADMAEWLYKAAHRNRFERIVLVAPPKVLGTLRQKLHKEVAGRVVGEIQKTLTGHPVDQIERIVADELAAA